MSGLVIHRYPLRAMVPDYVRAVLGLAAAAALAIGTDPAPLAAVIIAALAALFATLGVQAGLRHRSRLDVTDGGIRKVPRGEHLAWESLTGLRLGYFSLRRDGRRGWLELKLDFAGRTLRLDSRLQGFAGIVRRAAHEAERAGVALDRSTVENLRFLDDGRGGDIVARDHRSRGH